MAKWRRSEPVASSAAPSTSAEQPSRPRPRTTRILTAGVATLLTALVLIGTYQALPRPAGPAKPGAAAVDDLTVRDSSRRLSVAPDGKVTFVAFLDFECEMCGEVYPVVEQLRAGYGDRVTFVVRYFPLEGHVNAQRAARAVEAAAQQGQLEAMYRKMFQTQPEWAEQQEPKDELFRRYAADLGLDMDRWDAAYAADSTWEPIQADIDDGLALGVTATPALFLNGDELESTSLLDLSRALDQALAR